MTVAGTRGASLYDQIGVAADNKPAGLPAGAKFYETDTGDTYVYTGSSWVLYADEVNSDDVVTAGAITARAKAMAAAGYIWHTTGELDPLVDAGNFTDQGTGRYHGVIGIVGQAGNAAQWDKMRLSRVFKVIETLAVGSEATIWTPAAGKKFRLMGFTLMASAAVTLTLKDNTAGTTIFVTGLAANVPFYADLGNGILSGAADRVLTATASGAANLSGTVWGTEE